MNKNIGLYVWFTGVMFYFVQFIMRVSIGSIAPDIMKDLSMSPKEFSIIASSYYIPYCLAQIPMGILLDKLGYKKIFKASLILCSAGSLIFGCSDSMSMLFISRFIIGFCGASSFIGCIIIANEVSCKKNLPIAIGLIPAIGKIGGILASGPLLFIIGTKLIPSWRELYICLAILGLIIFIFMYIAMEKHEEEHVIENRDVLGSLKHVLSNKQIWIIGLYAGLTYVPIAVFADVWANLFVSQKYGEALGPYCVSMLFVGAVVGAPSIAALSKKGFTLKFLSIISNLLSLICFISLLYFPCPPNFAVILCLLIGIAYGSHAFVFTYPKQIFPSHMVGTANGVLNTINMCASMILLPVCGVIVELTSSEKGFYNFSYSLSVIPVAIIISIFLLFVIKGPWFLNHNKEYKKHL